MNTYGKGAEEWLSRAIQFLWQPDVIDLLQTEGFDIEPYDGGAQNLSAVIDDRSEIRFQHDFYVSYTQLSEGVDRTELTETIVDHDIVPGGSFTTTKP